MIERYERAIEDGYVEIDTDDYSDTNSTEYNPDEDVFIDLSDSDKAEYRQAIENLKKYRDEHFEPNGAAKVQRKTENAAQNAAESGAQGVNKSVENGAQGVQERAQSVQDTKNGVKSGAQTENTTGQTVSGTEKGARNEYSAEYQKGAEHPNTVGGMESKPGSYYAEMNRTGAQPDKSITKHRYSDYDAYLDDPNVVVYSADKKALERKVYNEYKGERLLLFVSLICLLQLAELLR